MTARRPGWSGWAALAICSATAGAVYAQSTEPPPEEPAEAAEPQFPDLLPGYYNQTLTFRAMNIDMNIPAKWGAVGNNRIEFPPITERICHTGEELQRASESLWGGMPGSDECQLVSATMIGTHGEGELVCASPSFRMVMRYVGEFTETSARFSLIARTRSKAGVGEVTMKADIVMERFAETCTEDIDDEEVDAAPAEVPSDLAVEYKKM